MADTYLILRNGSKGKAPYIRCKGLVAARARAVKMIDDIPTPDATVRIYSEAPFPVFIGEVAWNGSQYDFLWIPATGSKVSAIGKNGRIKESW